MTLQRILFCAFVFSLVVGFICCTGPGSKIQKVESDYIRPIPGPSDSIPALLAQKGEVLIAYSDCYTCHKNHERLMGPAFSDVAKRYPIRDVFIDLLARKIISGGSGSWGHAVMSPHPNVSLGEAKLMVNYVLSLKSVK